MGGIHIDWVHSRANTNQAQLYWVCWKVCNQWVTRLPHDHVMARDLSAVSCTISSGNAVNLFLSR